MAVFSGIDSVYFAELSLHFLVLLKVSLFRLSVLLYRAKPSYKSSDRSWGYPSTYSIPTYYWQYYPSG